MISSRRPNLCIKMMIVLCARATTQKRQHAPMECYPRSGSTYRTSDATPRDRVRPSVQLGSLRRRRCTQHPSSASCLQMQCRSIPIIRLCSTTSRRYNTLQVPALPADDFLWYPHFFDQAEQRTLLSAALRKLDSVEPRASRKRRRDFLASRRQDQSKDIEDLRNTFLPDDLYHFEEVRSWRLRPVAGNLSYRWQ
jgi:hypothetical protein